MSLSLHILATAFLFHRLFFYKNCNKYWSVSKICTSTAMDISCLPSLNKSSLKRWPWLTMQSFNSQFLQVSTITHYRSTTDVIEGLDGNIIHDDTIGEVR